MDYEEAKLWDKYMEMYEECFEKFNKVPLIITPADQNWYKEYIIASTLHKTLKGFDMKFPGIEK